MQRITSIDALRAFALLGILLVHVTYAAGFGALNYTNTVDSLLGAGVWHLFVGRFVLIFNTLFGVSFYIILSKKDYPASRFVWRCFLLALLGLLNGVFFSHDVLFKYGVCGMFLVPLRKLSGKWIMGIILALFAAGVFLVGQDWGSFIECPFRYVEGLSFVEFLKTYPSFLLSLAKDFLNGYYLLIYSTMAIGYLLGRSGVIEAMDSKLTATHVVISLSIYLLLGALSLAFKNIFLVKRILCLSGAAFYWILFVWLYNKSGFCHRLFSRFEPYGKLGLTNYTMQGFSGVLVFYLLGLGASLPFTLKFLLALVFFVLQAVFSAVWLKHFRNGPLEYLWRCATARKWLPLRAGPTA